MALTGLIYNTSKENDREQWRRSLAEAGLTLVDGSFEEGATVSAATAAVWHIASGQCYTWGGTLPKTVPAGSTPETSVGVGAWQPVGSAILRQQLLDGPVDLRNGGFALRNIVTVSDFGGQSGFNNDSSKALTDFINYINSGKADYSLLLIDGLYKTTTPLPSIRRPCILSGISPTSSAILFSGIEEGLLFDLSSYIDSNITGSLEKVSIITDMTVAPGDAFKYIPSAYNGVAVPKFRVSEVNIMGLDRFSGETSDMEWGCGIKLGEDIYDIKISEVRLNNTHVYGSERNGKYSTMTGSGSSGVIASKATSCFISESSFLLLDGYGVRFKGQSEGNIVEGSSVVAARYGIVFDELKNPSNNHFVSNTHINPYEIGLKISYSDTGATSPIVNCATNVFILERGDSEEKRARFVGVDFYSRFSSLTNVTVWANKQSSANSNGKVAFRITQGDNSLINCTSHNMTYAIEVYNLTPAQERGVKLVNFTDDSSISGFTTPESTTFPKGDVSSTVLDRNWRSPLTYCNNLSLINTNTGLQFLEAYNTTLKMVAQGADSNVISHYPNGSTVAGGVILSKGGDSTTANQGSVYLRYKTTYLGGDLRPETANARYCGAANYQWAGGFTQTAFTVTSDERSKTKPVEITDLMLDAWSEVEWVQYKYLDRVDEKGEEARWHYGVIAQRAVEAFERHGINAHDFGFLCHDEWDDSEAVIDEETGKEITPAVVKGDRYGIRYEEALSLEAALQRRNYQRLLSRVEALENKLSKE